MSFRLFELITDGNSVTCTDELRKVRVKCVVREASHLAASAIAHCQCDAEDISGFLGIFIVTFVEITAAEEEQRIRMFPLQILIL